jgi:hypothetical protein
VEAYPMTIRRFLARWWRQLVAVLLVLAAVAGYGLARGDSGGGTGGEFSASPPASTTPDPARSANEPTTNPGAATSRSGVTPPTGDAPTDPTDPDGPDGTGSGTRVTTNKSTTSQQTTTQPSRSEHWVIRWILSLAPEGPTSPTSNVKPYMLLRDRECSEALTWIDSPDNKDQVSDRERAIYRGTATACLAAFHQQPQRWVEAHRHLADANSSSEELNCPARLTLAWLQRVVGLHEQDRDRTFVDEQPQGVYAGIQQQLEPARGSAGEQVRVEGTNLDCVSFVSVDRKSDSKDAVSARYTVDPSGRRLTFTAPDGFDPSPVDVTFDGNETYVVGRATFTYEDSSAGG